MLAACLFVLSGCSDTERSWAYKYRYKFEEPTVTPRLSTHYRTKEECEKQMAEFSSFQVALDRCVLQPPISLGWIEWESSIDLRVRAPNEPTQEERFTFITQTLSDCRKLRSGMLTGLQRNMMPKAPANVTPKISAASCRPIYIGNRDEYTPLQVSDFEGILVRSKAAKK
jgi:hypothetical protein